jgi:hypothetical protein
LFVEAYRDGTVDKASWLPVRAYIKVSWQVNPSFLSVRKVPGAKVVIRLVHQSKRLPLYG